MPYAFVYKAVRAKQEKITMTGSQHSTQYVSIRRLLLFWFFQPCHQFIKTFGSGDESQTMLALGIKIKAFTDTMGHQVFFDTL